MWEKGRIRSRSLWPTDPDADPWGPKTYGPDPEHWCKHLCWCWLDSEWCRTWPSTRTTSWTRATPPPGYPWGSAPTSTISRRLRYSTSQCCTDPDLAMFRIWIGSGFTCDWSRSKKTKMSQKKRIIFWRAAYSLLEGGGFSCSFEVLHGGLRIIISNKVQFLIRKLWLLFLLFWSSETWICIHKGALVRIWVQWIWIRWTVFFLALVIKNIYTNTISAPLLC